MPPMGEAMTGTPAAMASSTLTGNPALYEGRTKAAAVSSSARLPEGPTQPVNFTASWMPRRLA